MCLAWQVAGNGDQLRERESIIGYTLLGSGHNDRP
jgi:hypothetical protein